MAEDEDDEEKLLDELRTLHKKLKRPLFKKDVVATGKRGECSPVSRFNRAFVPVLKAIEMAGAGVKKYTRSELSSYLRDIRLELGRAPRIPDLVSRYRDAGGPNMKRLLKEFGTFDLARRAAGIIAPRWKSSDYHASPPPGRVVSIPVPQDQLILELKNLGNSLGRKPSDRDIYALARQGEMNTSTMFARVFGSLNNAYKAAGFTRIRTHEYSTEEVIEKVRDQIIESRKTSI